VEHGNAVAPPIVPEAHVANLAPKLFRWLQNPGVHFVGFNEFVVVDAKIVLHQ